MHPPQWLHCELESTPWSMLMSKPMSTNSADKSMSIDPIPAKPDMPRSCLCPCEASSLKRRAAITLVRFKAIGVVWPFFPNLTVFYSFMLNVWIPISFANFEACPAYRANVTQEQQQQLLQT